MLKNIMCLCNTKRLIIRHFRESDSDFILKLLNEESFIKNIGDKQVRTNDDAIKYLKEGPLASYQQHVFGLNVVLLKDSLKPIGMCGLLKRDQLEYPDLGYALLPEYCAMGYAKEAAKVVIKNAHEKHKLTHVLAFTSQNNTPSNTLLKRLGFIFKRRINMNGSDDNLYEYSFIR